jgi:hypothetical protein
VPDPDDQGLTPARIPADIEREDQVLGPLTARQAAILAATALALWLGYLASRPLIAPIAYLALVAPIAAVATAIAVGRRDGISMDRFLLAAVAFWHTPKRQVQAPEGVPALPDAVPARWAGAAGTPPVALVLPCREIADTGVVDLGRDGHAALAVCGTVNFDLRTSAEQQALTGSFARWLNSLTGPVQILVRAHRLEVNPLVEALSATAPSLPHPALERAALAHADFLHAIAHERDLLTRQVLLVTRETASPGPGRTVGAGPSRVRHRLAEAARALGAAEISVTPLDGPAAARAITTASDPDTTPRVPTALGGS